MFRGPGRLTNADFRRLMMTPRAPAGSTSSKEIPDASTKATTTEDTKGAKGERRDPKEEAKATERKKKKR